MTAIKLFYWGFVAAWLEYDRYPRREDSAAWRAGLRLGVWTMPIAVVVMFACFMLVLLSVMLLVVPPALVVEYARNLQNDSQAPVSDIHYVEGQEYTITWSELNEGQRVQGLQQPEWQYTIGDLMVTSVKAPNRFHRWMQKVCLGITWGRT